MSKDKSIIIRVTDEKKARLESLAKDAGMSLSEYMLSRSEGVEIIRTTAEAVTAVKKIKPKEDGERLVSGWKSTAPVGSLLKK